MWSPNELLKIEKQRDILSYITLQFFHFKKVPLEHCPLFTSVLSSFVRPLLQLRMQLPLQRQPTIAEAAIEKCSSIFLCIECEAYAPNSRYRPSAGAKYPLYKSPDLCEGCISLSNGEAFLLLCPSLSAPPGRLPD